MSPLRQASLLEVNEFLVLDYVREQGRTTRARIAADLSLSPASVSRIVKRLLHEGTVVESARTTSPTPGRPPSAIEFNRSRGTIVAIDLGGTKCHGALADLGGAILRETVRPTDSSGDPYSTLLSTIESLSGEATAMDVPVAAVAIGIPAMLDPNNGFALAGPNVHWLSFPLAGRLKQDLHVPFTVDNDANLAALGHAWRGQGKSVPNFAVIALGTGIGAAIVLNGRLIRGQHNAAGEVGFLVLNREQLHQPQNGRMGALEELASGSAIGRRAHDLLARYPDSALERSGEITAKNVFAAAKASDPLALSVLDELIDHVAMAIIAIVSSVDPDLVILEGGVGRALDSYVDTISRRVADRVPAPPRIVISNLESNATLLGAIAVGLELARQGSIPSVLFESFGFDMGIRHAR